VRKSPSEKTRRVEEPVLGPRLREARQARGMTLEQLAEASGLSRGFISQVERDAVSASVGSLFRICKALDTTVGALLEPEWRQVIRRADQHRVTYGGEDVWDYALTPSNEARLQVVETHIGPGGTAGDEFYSVNGDVEMIYVIKGSLEIRFQDRDIVLEAGDSFTFNPQEPHSWRNPSRRGEAIVIFAVSPAAF